MFIDTHAHLTDKKYGDDLDPVLNRARARGVDAVIDVGDSLDSSRLCLDHARRYGDIFAAVGIHPHNAAGATGADERVIGGFAGEPEVVAIGEIGLDFYRNLSPRESQERLFRKLLRIAVEKGLPVIMHCRSAYPDLISILGEMRRDGLSGVVHCFSGNIEEAEKIIAMGYYISVGGPLTYPGSEGLRDTVRRLPIDRILLETDCPYLSPQPKRGKRNEPANLAFIAEELARLRGLRVEEVAVITTANARRLFPKLTAD